ncbi:MAG: HAD family phosphatase [Acidobacteriota bacterium]
MFRALLLDFNGILLDDEPLHLELLNRILTEEGIPSIETSLEDIIGRTDQDFLTATLSAHDRAADPSLVMRLVIRKATYYQEAVRRNGYSFFEGAQNLLQQARDAELAVGVVSGALRQEIEDALGQIGALDGIKFIISSEDVERGKPDPEGYILGLNNLNSLSPLPTRLIHPHEVLAIEDTPAGLSAANDAGLFTVGIAHTFPEETLAQLASATHPSLTDLDLEALEELYRRHSAS